MKDNTYSFYELINIISLFLIVILMNIFIISSLNKELKEQKQLRLQECIKDNFSDTVCDSCYKVIYKSNPNEIITY